MVTGVRQKRRGVRRRQHVRQKRRGFQRQQHLWEERSPETAVCAAGEERSPETAACTTGEGRNQEVAPCGGRPVSGADEILGACEEDAPNEDGRPKGTPDYGGRRRTEAGHILERTWHIQV
ncbi:hypothetical protein NDU88_006245 [Pleurodeles waltl]|uniref:Uncharacterized protein n=1 Tax=Pleurodeles waltl TaxID=8319 RepID=A0AAV7VLC5_PLEWA|nr:hypothetical protein NDU88_006245 [Pleurodeles waltl]